VGPAADEVVETLVVVAVFVPGVAVDALDVVSVVPDFDVVVPEPLPLETTCVVGLFLMMLVGLPSVASQGPLLPPSSQFM
jgi:hypothetical protein